MPCFVDRPGTRTGLIADVTGYAATEVTFQGWDKPRSFWAAVRRRPNILGVGQTKGGVA